jgi:aspartate/methionine/tyrosine aminotransferase
MRLAPFRIERYYALHEFTTPLMLSSSDSESVTVAELLALEPKAGARLHAERLGYTEATGSLELRQAIAAVYATATVDDVLVLSAAEEAIFATYHSLVGSGDHVIVETPCYESAIEVARSTGATVSEWRRLQADDWAHDLDGLEALIRPETRLLYINTPHNPTGTHMSRQILERVVQLAAEQGAWLICDEVYRELEHDPRDRLPAAADLYPRALSLGSLSKTYGLPGLRLGWLCSHDRDALARIRDFKHYTTICSSAPSELLAAIALRHRDVLVNRNRSIVERNLPLLDEFLARSGGVFSWTRPSASPIGFLRVHGFDDVDALCDRIRVEAGVLLLPGSVYDEPSHVRVGYGRANMPEALHRLSDWLTNAA